MAMKHQESDVAFIKALAELLRENDLTEIEVSREYGEDDALNVRVARQIQVTAAPVVPVAPVAAQPIVPAVVEQAAAAAVSDPAEDPGVVVSPMVGTVYLQAQPGSPAFVKVGDTLAEGQTILIIEAMKTMNQIPAPRAGRVKRILVEDGSPVEFGAPLIILE
ncbi:acetyl-CoA carboxylase biotin carboxyl carrier protein [Amaricoccus sp. W119]|uniref:acetyl-CoA carboxylase biotin carboxyl carrier protein n=1 Tax=Amaricoccus sp. W119 TaxID=3391833 RepID=UPI0039A40D71